jgi:hypothetical protein
MFADFNWLGAIAAAVVAMVIGFIWYMPAVFGSAWMKALGKKMEELGSPKVAVPNALLMNVISALVLTHAIKAMGAETLMDALHIALGLSVGLIVTNQLMRDRFHGMSGTLSLINGANTVVTYLAMGAAIALV